MNRQPLPDARARAVSSAGELAHSPCGPGPATGLLAPDPVPMDVWRGWLGLPHVVGADPRNGKGACCMVAAQIILSELGLNPPDIKDWIRLAQEQKWIELQLLFDEHFISVFEPCVGTVALIRNGAAGLGVATYLDGVNGLLVVHHARGVATMPLRLARLLQFAKLRT